MVCKDAKHTAAFTEAMKVDAVQPETKAAQEELFSDNLLFGVDSTVPADDILQNNLSMFEWVLRNKIHPNFWGRNLEGENALTKEEVEFLHGKACKVAAILMDKRKKQTAEEGKAAAEIAIERAVKLGIPEGCGIFLHTGEESVTRDYLKGFSEEMIYAGYTPAFRANTDAKCNFDREFSRGLQTHREIFEKCLVWALAPSLKEYDRVTTTHLIKPDTWVPYAPSSLKRKDIALWQYGKDCHPIDDDKGMETVFNINLLKNFKIIIDKMF